MFQNWTKKSSIIYLIGGALLFAVLFFVSFVIVIWADGKSQYELTELQKLGISALGGLIPLASFTGFCVGFIRINELSVKQIILLIVFCIPLVVLTVLFGAVMLIPCIINAVKTIRKPNGFAE